MPKKRVVITGLGAVTPNGNDIKTSWENILQGKSGIGNITIFKANTYRSKVAGEVKNFDFTTLYEKKHLNKAKKMDLFVHYGYASCLQASQMSGINIEANPQRIGVCLGSGIGGLAIQMQNGDAFRERGHRKVSPFYIPGFIGNIASGFVSMLMGLSGANMSTQTACATGNHAIASAFMIIKMGMADAIFAGGTESAVLDIAVAGFDNMKALSTRYNDTPEKASRPYDKGRDGFVIAEGAGVCLLEDYEVAKARGADILCEVVSVGLSADAYDLVKPRPDGEGAYQCMKMAIDQAQIEPSKISYINSHGTSTPLGDIAEAKAIRRIVNDDQTNLHVNSTKSMLGHSLGATAGIEAAICALSIKNNIIPPATNIEELDPDVGLTCINTEPLEKNVDIVISNSFGFGGHNSAICFKKI